MKLFKFILKGIIVSFIIWCLIIICVGCGYAEIHIMTDEEAKEYRKERITIVINNMWLAYKEGYFNDDGIINATDFIAKVCRIPDTDMCQDVLDLEAGLFYNRGYCEAYQEHYHGKKCKETK